jgi:SAM-dependent methyltransferase
MDLKNSWINNLNELRGVIWENYDNSDFEYRDHIRGILSDICEDFSSYPIEYQEKFWTYIIESTKHNNLRLISCYAIPDIFSRIPESFRGKAWSDLHNIIVAKQNNYSLICIAETIGKLFEIIPEKGQSFGDLITLTHNQNRDVRMAAIHSLERIFLYEDRYDEVDRKLVFFPFIRLINDKDIKISWVASNFLSSNLSCFPKELQNTAWISLYALVYDENPYTREMISDVLEKGYFTIGSHYQSKICKAFKELIHDECENVSRRAFHSLCMIFLRSPESENREKIWSIINCLKSVNDQYYTALLYQYLGYCAILHGIRGKEIKKWLEIAIEYYLKSVICIKSINKGLISNPSRLYPSELYIIFYRAVYQIYFEECNKEEVIDNCIRSAHNLINNIQNKKQLENRVTILCKEFKEYINTLKNERECLENVFENCREIENLFAFNDIGTIFDNNQKIHLEVEEKEIAIIKSISSTLYQIIREDDSLVNIFIDLIYEKTRQISKSRISNRTALQILIYFNELCNIVDQISVEKKFCIEYLSFNQFSIPERFCMLKNIIWKITVEAKINKKIKPLLNLNSEQIIGLIFTLDLLKDRYQKEIRKDIEEANLKAIYSIKCRIQEELICSDNPIEWLDIGCGTGRCLYSLGVNPDKTIYSPSQLERIHYTGVDSSAENLYATEQLASKYKGLKFSSMHCDIEDLEGGTKYNFISWVLVFNEMSPKSIPKILEKLINLLKDNGILFISNFRLPFTLDKEIVFWDGDDLKDILNQMGYLNLDSHFIYESVKTEKIPDEYGLFRLVLTKPPDKETINNHDLNTNYNYNYNKFLEEKKRKTQTFIDNLIMNLEMKNGEKITNGYEKQDYLRILNTIREKKVTLDQLVENSEEFSKKDFYQMGKMMMLNYEKDLLSNI